MRRRECSKIADTSTIKVSQKFWRIFKVFPNREKRREGYNGRVKDDQEFWNSLEELVSAGEIKIDRPKGSAHPRYPDYIYPFDYGYIADTTSSDGEGIDIWQINESKQVTGLVVTFDPVKKDSEMKILLGASEVESNQILDCHRRGSMQALLILR